MADLHVNIAGVNFGNPLIAASGTFGFGREYSEFYPLSVLGGISCKGITTAFGQPPAPHCRNTRWYFKLRGAAKSRRRPLY